jgi:hypothetical protein
MKTKTATFVVRLPTLTSRETALLHNSRLFIGASKIVTNVFAQLVKHIT